MFQEFIDYLKDKSQVSIVVHKDPDGDALGSGLALKLILAQLNIKATIYCSTTAPATYCFLPNITSIVTEQLPGFETTGAAPNIITVDTGAMSQIGQDLIIDVNIDHHLGNTRYAKLNIIIPTAAATGEIIYNLAKELEAKISPEIATCLYVAISTDTGHFRFSNTTKDTFLISSELVKAGANPGQIAHQIYEQLPFIAVKKIGEGLNKMQQTADGKIVWSSNEEYKDHGPRSIIDFLREVDTCEVAVTFTKKDENITKVSLRSKTNFDVRLFAEQFGGGGHPKASGITLEKNMEEAEILILDRLKGDFRNKPKL